VADEPSSATDSFVSYQLLDQFGPEGLSITSRCPPASAAPIRGTRSWASAAPASPERAISKSTAVDPLMVELVFQQSNLSIA
jgi:hypothetical protein